MTTRKSHLPSVACYGTLRRQWHPIKNGELEPSQVTIGSTLQIWWQCPEGPDHVWTTSPNNRVALHNGRHKVLGCPYCKGRRASQTNNLATVRPDLADEWHKKKNGKLTPTDVTVGSDKQVWWRCRQNRRHVWKTSVCTRSSGGGCPFCSGHRVSAENSLAVRYPDVAADWHSTKNGDLTAKDVSFGSTRKVWWQCDKVDDHAWQVSPNGRTSPVRRGQKPRGCPFCARRAPESKSLATCSPDVAEQWHPTKNGTLTPNDVASRSARKVWWQCPEDPDHVWSARIESRTIKRSGCPYCRVHVSATKSLAALFPEVAAQWHPDKNGELTPDQIVAGSHARVWWRCPEGPDHEWQTSVSHRTHAQSNCPYCAGQRVSVTNSLESLYPDMARQLHRKKNGKLRPRDVFGRTGKKVWWKCKKGPDHEWLAAVYNRTVRGSGCPFCAGRLVSVTNCLARLYPKVAGEWHPKKNADLTPSDVAAAASDFVWWKCPVGHVYRARVQDRTVKGRGCPRCGGGAI